MVPVYVQRPVNTGGILTPTNGTLVGFARVDLAAGASQTVSVRFPTSALALTPGDIDGTARPTVQPGAYSVVLDPTNPASGVSFTVS